MSRGSYFTLYRKHSKIKLDEKALNDLKNEYFQANKDGIFYSSKDRSDDDMKKDIPLVMDSSYKAKCSLEDSEKHSNDYYDRDGILHIKLLEFSFGSMFTCLKEHFNLNPYSFASSSTLISKHEAAKMLQAIEYILAEEYDKKFEKILGNEYVIVFGDGYSPFDNRFKNAHSPIYIDKESDGSYTMCFSDYAYDAEMSENDEDIRICLGRAKACLLAYLNADELSWNGEDLVLEYSVYG